MTDDLESAACPHCAGGLVTYPLQLGTHGVRCDRCRGLVRVTVRYGGAFGGLHAEIHPIGRDDEAMTDEPTPDEPQPDQPAPGEPIPVETPPVPMDPPDEPESETVHFEPDDD